MKLILEPSAEMVTVVHQGNEVRCRTWTGETETGVPVIAQVILVQVPKGRPEADYEAFERELKEVQARQAAAIDLRYLID